MPNNEKTVIVANLSDEGAMQTLREAVVEAVKQHRVVRTEYTQTNACTSFKVEIENKSCFPPSFEQPLVELRVSPDGCDLLVVREDISIEWDPAQKAFFYIKPGVHRINRIKGVSHA